SFAAAWKVSQEDFMETLPVFSNLKLRASLGRTGNQAIGNYHSLVTFNKGPNGVINENPITTQDPARLANHNLKWETTEQINIGLDVGLWKGRLSGSIDYYRKNTSDMLVNLHDQTSTGFNTKLSNVGNIRNSGWELTLNSINLDQSFR